jgi:hypothetical protein
MLSYLDPILFPDQLEIYRVDPDRYIYPIYKNGSSSLRASAERVHDYKQIARLQVVEVFVREPFERYVSGVQTWLRHNPELDRPTALKFVGDFLFLNSHFSLQFHWLVNLQRFTQAWMHIRPIDELNTATDLAWNVLARDESLIEYFQDNHKLWYYLQLDKVLWEDLRGQTVTMRMIVAHIKNKYPALYTEIIQRDLDLCGVLD